MFLKIAGNPDNDMYLKIRKYLRQQDGVMHTLEKYIYNYEIKITSLWLRLAVTEIILIWKDYSNYHCFHTKRKFFSIVMMRISLNTDK